MPKAPLFVFSGLDCAGKTTQINRLLDYLRRRGLKDPVYFWSRGGYTPLFEKAKRLMRRTSGRALMPSGDSVQRTQTFRKSWVRRLWLAASLLDLMLVYGVGIRWWRMQGRPVVCDRYLWDTLVDFRLNFPQEKVEEWRLWRLLVFLTPQAEASFLLLIPVEESMRRSKLKAEPFPDSPEALARRRDCYEAQVAEGRWQVLDGQRPVADVFAEIKERVDRVAHFSAANEELLAVESSSLTA